MNMAQESPSDTTPRLSDFIEPTTRRGFLANASVLSFAIPGLGAAIAACSPGDGGKSDTTSAAPVAATAGQAGAPPTLHNPDSRLDTALMKGGHPGSTAAGVSGTATYHRFD